jgi:heme/copper-type cytochrome/quinol oxidase subunit 3
MATTVSEARAHAETGLPGEVLPEHSDGPRAFGWWGMAWLIAERGIRGGHQGRLRWGLAVGFLLGAVFLFITLAVEWPEKARHFTPTTNVYGSLFFTVTGFHAAHVAAGLAVGAWTQALAWRGTFDERRHLTVQNFALYWHFVDVVWAFVLFAIYLSPNL